MTKSRRNLSNTDGASSSSANMAARVNKLEVELQAELRELKDQLLGTQESAGTPETVSQYLEKITQFEKRMAESISGLKNDIKAVGEKLLEWRQESGVNILIFNGVSEKGGAGDSDEVRKIIKNHLKIDVNMADIDYCRRLGRKSSLERARPLAVRFVNLWFRDKIFSEKKKLKGSGVVVSEFLVSSTLSLFKAVRGKIGIKNCWTWRGGIYISVDNKKTRIRSLSDLQSIE